MRNWPVTILAAPDTGSQTGSSYFVGQAGAASFTAIFKDTAAAGTIQIQGSNEISTGAPEAYVPSSASFSNIPSGSSTVVAGVAPAIVMQSLCFQYIRAVFTSTNAGTTTVLVNASLLAI